jgi:hypothetical protein
MSCREPDSSTSPMDQRSAAIPLILEEIAFAVAASDRLNSLHQIGFDLSIRPSHRLRTFLHSGNLSAATAYGDGLSVLPVSSRHR